MAVVGLVLSASSCDKSGKKSGQSEQTKAARELPPSPFVAEKAYAHIAQQLAFGSRVPNTEAHRATANYIVGELEQLGLEVTRQEMSVSYTHLLGGAFDRYLGDYHEHDGRIIPYRVDKLRVLNGKGIGHFKGTSTSFSYTFNRETINKISNLFSKKKKKEGNDDEGSTDNPPNQPPAPPRGCLLYTSRCV